MMEYKILGPVIIPDIKMIRYHDEIGEYELVISKETIELCRNKFHREKKESNINLNHSSERYTGSKMTDSFLINDENRLQLPEEFFDLPNGTWMIEMTYNNAEEYNQIVNSGLTGFSMQGSFIIKGQNGEKYKVYEYFRIMNKLSDLLPFNVHVFGGSTSGAGKNEHGNAHFQLKEKNTGRDLGKIYMSSLDIWQKSSDKEKIKLLIVHSGKQISNKAKKAMIYWLNKNNCENLVNSHTQWNQSNKDNNRVTFI